MLQDLIVLHAHAQERAYTDTANYKYFSRWHETINIAIILDIAYYLEFIFQTQRLVGR
jgi:hypothetical protein